MSSLRKLAYLFLRKLDEHFGDVDIDCWEGVDYEDSAKAA